MPRFRIIQNRMTVAATEGLDAEAAIMFYAMQYREEGPATVEVRHKSPTRPGKFNWKRFAHFEKWPDPNAEE